MKHCSKRKSTCYQTEFVYDFYNTWNELFLKEYGLEHYESFRLAI